MWRPRRVFAIILAGVILTSLIGAAPARRTARRPGSAHDCIAVRVMFKSWSWKAEMDCGGMNWGWDSLTWRVRAGQPVPATFFFFERPTFAVGRALSPDSAWLTYRVRDLALEGHATDWRSAPELDSVVITSRWTPTFTTIGVSDAWMRFRVRLVTPWPAPAPRPTRTTTLRGKVIDDSTGCAVFFRQVIFDGTKLVTHSDTLGYFVLNDVPVGSVGLDACAAAYLAGHLDVA